jgi:hypothetical protein
MQLETTFPVRLITDVMAEKGERLISEATKTRTCKQTVDSIVL